MLKKSSAVLKMTALALIVALTVSVIPFGVTAERIDRIPTAVIDASEKYAPNATITAGQDDSYRYMTWYNETEGKQYVKWVEADKVIDGVFPEDCYQTEVGPTNGVFRAKLTNLKSDTDYAYMIGGDKTGWSEIYNFSTGDMDDNAFSFLLFGDPQVNTNVDGENWNISLEKAKEWFGDDIEFILSVGDQT
ncbi:MAG: fibronectin type III domain-containing protein, partial [Clostridia bacterium]|nr:fibronectin type III domain-containing protein [Clostridia bacterium]